jgi:putative FmdB family regulatory protein
MPLYDYQCAACRRRFEVVHGVHADGPTTCPLCGKGPVRKAISAPAVHYKGSGWAKKERRATVKSGSSKAGAEDGSTSDSSGNTETPAAPEGKDSGSAKPAATPRTAGSGATKTTD